MQGLLHLPCASPRPDRRRILILNNKQKVATKSSMLMLVCAHGQYLACTLEYATVPPHVHPTCLGAVEGVMGGAQTAVQPPNLAAGAQVSTGSFRSVRLMPECLWNSGSLHCLDGSRVIPPFLFTSV
jgi:hypothetical protein